MIKFRRNILMLDDDADLIAEMKKNFNWAGHEVFVGVEGLKELMAQSKTGIPDLIILDPLMSGLNGYEFYKSLKQDPLLSATPVMILTSRCGLQETYEKLGCDFFAAKPFDANEIVKVTSELLVRKVLILESDDWIKNRIGGTFPASLYRLKFVGKMRDLMLELTAGYYHAVLCSVDLIVAAPASFALAVRRASKNRNIRLIVYYEESPDAIETTDVIFTEKIQKRWRSIGGIFYYDSRLEQKPFPKYLAENA